MYNPTALRTAFVSLVGILQSDISNVPQVLPPLSVSDTGIFVQDKNELLSLQNIWYAAPDFNLNNYNIIQYTPGDISQGQIVTYQTQQWQAKVNITNSVNPISDGPTYWSVFNPFQAWLQQKYNQAVTNLFAEVIQRKKLLYMGKAILERQQLYRGSGQLNNAIISDGSFVGVEIRTTSAEGLLAIIDMIGIQSNQSQDAMTYYLYNSTVATPLEIWTLPIDNANTFSWQKLTDEDGVLNCILKYLEQDTSSVFYFGYYQSDLEGQAISKEWNASAMPCFGCDGVDSMAYNLWSRYTSFRGIKVPSIALDSGKNLFNTSKVEYGNITNWD